MTQPVDFWTLFTHSASGGCNYYLQAAPHSMVGETNIKDYLEAASMVPNLQFAARHHKECLRMVGLSQKKFPAHFYRKKTNENS